MTEGLGFSFTATKNNEVKIHHRRKPATTLRSDKARCFLEDMDGMDFGSQQQEIARITGNYRRGNERTAKQHSRNPGESRLELKA
jgi:hypothetical protein